MTSRTCYLLVMLPYIEAVLGFSFAFPIDIKTLTLYINALPLFVLLITVKIWAPKLAGSRFQISCDNDAAVQVVRSGRTRDVFLQRCLRQLWFTSARYDLELHVSHIPGVHNAFALVVGILILPFTGSSTIWLLSPIFVFTCYLLTVRI